MTSAVWGTENANFWTEYFKTKYANLWKWWCHAHEFYVFSL